MNPIAINLFGIDIHWYGVMIGLGFLAALYMCQRRRNYVGLTEDQVINIAVLTMVAGVVGSRINYVITYWPLFKDKSVWDFFAVRNGGLVFYGGFILASVSVLIYTRLRKRSILRVADLLAMALPLAHAFGRVGCFFQGCCFGGKTACPVCVQYPNTLDAEHGRYWYQAVYERFGEFPALHPVQLYECTGNVLIFLILYKLLGRTKLGQIAALYAILYGILRFSVEHFRGEYTPETLIWGLFTPGQQVSVFLVPLGVLAFLFFQWKSAPAMPYPPPPPPAGVPETRIPE